MWTNLDKSGQNCVEFGHWVWYDVYVPKEATKLHRKTRRSFSMLCERHVHRAVLFVYLKAQIRKERRKFHERSLSSRQAGIRV